MDISADERVLRALSNESRRKIIDYLYAHGPSSYSKIMRATGFGVGESGRFSYHLRKLVDAGLVGQLSDGRYSLTPMGAKVARIMHEETAEVPSITETIEEFLNRIDQSRFIHGSLLVYAGLAYTVVGGLRTLLAALNLPVEVKLLGATYHYTPGAAVSAAVLAIGVALLLAGLWVLKKVAPDTGVLELLIYQRYSYLLLSRSKHLKRYLAMYILATISWLILLFAPV